MMKEKHATHLSSVGRPLSLQACFLFAAAMSGFHESACADSYHVATWGSNSNPGTLQRPFKTLAAGVRSLRAGDTLYVRGGTYYESLWVPNSGTAKAPIVIRSYGEERPVIDGQYWRGANWRSLVNLAGSYLRFQGFEVKNGLGQGILISGNRNLVSRCNVHHHAERGVLLAGDYGTVEYTRVWWNAWHNCRLATCARTKYPNGGWGTGLSAARGSGDGLTVNATLRGNTVFNNWGEGLSSFEADGTIIDSNVVYDNWQINIYVSDSANTLVSRNLVYTTPDNSVQAVPVNIGLSDERGTPRSQNVTIINNLVKGGRRNLFWWVDRRVPDARMRNVLIANNTFVDTQNADRWGASITFASANHANVRFVNNIVKEAGVAACISVGGGDVRFSSNLWSKQPSARATAWNDVIGAPLLTQAGPTGAGNLAGAWFKLWSTSPAVDAGSVVSRVADDFSGKPRDTTPDIGGQEF